LNLQNWLGLGPKAAHKGAQLGPTCPTMDPTGTQILSWVQSDPDGPQIAAM
jgi:hypothetical protein